MTRPTARVLALLEILQAHGGTLTVGELAGRLGVDERTVRRYAAHLLDLDVPVRSVRGRYGGYRLAPGYRMPPLMLSGDEALAVLLGLEVGSRVGLLSTSVDSAASAAAKVRRVLPRALARRLEALLETTDFTAGHRPVSGASTDVLLVLGEAARDRRPVHLVYTAADGSTSERTLGPYGVVSHEGRWYVVGADSASGETRTFRSDRVTSARLLDGEVDVPADFDAVAHVLAGLASAPHRHRVLLRVRGALDEVAAAFPRGLATVSPQSGTTGPQGEEVRVELHVERLDWVPGLLAGLVLPVVVDAPQELRDLVRALSARLAEAADAGVG